MKKLIHLALTTLLIVGLLVGFGTEAASANPAIALQFDCQHVGVYVIPDPGLSVVLETSVADYTTGAITHWGYPWQQTTIRTINLWNAWWFPAYGTHTYNFRVTVYEFFHAYSLNKTITCTVNLY